MHLLRKSSLIIFAEEEISSDGSEYRLITNDNIYNFKSIIVLDIE